MTSDQDTRDLAKQYLPGLHVHLEILDFDYFTQKLGVCPRCVTVANLTNNPKLRFTFGPTISLHLFDPEVQTESGRRFLCAEG